MRFLSLLLLVSLSAGVAAAQDAPAGQPEAPGVSVSKSGWRREVRNPMLDEDPMMANQDERDKQRVQRQAERENRIRAREGLERNPPPNVVNPTRTRDGGRYVEYVYEIKITNTGTKTIRALEWGYVLLDPGTGSEAGHNRFVHEAGLRPGKSKGLIARSPSPPARVIDVSRSDKETRGQFSEHVVIHRIIYEDGTTWERGIN
jgi:hypothetical protein